MLVRCRQAGARGRECLGKARRSGVCKSKGKRGGESNKTRARQGGMQRWSRAQLYGWRCSERAKRRAKRGPSDKITAGVGLSLAGWGALAQLEACRSARMQIRLASKCKSVRKVMTCRPRPCCTSDGPMDRELASPAAPACVCGWHCRYRQAVAGFGGGAVYFACWARAIIIIILLDLQHLKDDVLAQRTLAGPSS
jgi:hypothetical protein